MFSPIKHLLPATANIQRPLTLSLNPSPDGKALRRVGVVLLRPARRLLLEGC
jgi:hypothetical protein